MSKKNREITERSRELIRNLCIVACMFLVIVVACLIGFKYSSETMANGVVVEDRSGVTTEAKDTLAKETIDTQGDWIYYEDFMDALSSGRAVANDGDGILGYDIGSHVVGDPDADILEKIEISKNILREEYGEYKDFDWDNFENMQFKAYEFTSSDQMAAAFYHSETNMIYYDAAKFKMVGDSDIITHFVHELIHVLVPPANVTQFDEALTVYMTEKAYPCNHISYLYSYMIVDRYLEKHDLSEAIYAMRDGTLMTKIEEDIGKPDVLKNTQGLYLYFNCNLSNRNYNNSLVIMDIYAHYVAKTGGVDKKSANYLNTIYSQVPGSIQEKSVVYFGKVLGAEFRSNT